MKRNNNELLFYCMMAFVTCHFSFSKTKVWSWPDDRLSSETKFWGFHGLWRDAWAWKIACKYYEYVLVRFFTRPKQLCFQHNPILWFVYKENPNNNNEPTLYSKYRYLHFSHIITYQISIWCHLWSIIIVHSDLFTLCT